MVDVLEQGVWLSCVSGGCVRTRSVAPVVSVVDVLEEGVGSVVDVLEEGVWLSGVSGGCVRRRSVAQWGQWWMC